MEIYISFNKEVYKTWDNIRKLMSLDFIDIVEEEQGYFKFKAESLKDFDSKLKSIHTVFNWEVSVIISPDDLELFLEFIEE